MMKYKEINIPWYRFWRTKKEKEQELFNKGYCWAAGKLLSGGTYLELESYIDCAIHFDDYCHFEYGMETAIEDFKHIKKEVISNDEI